VALGACGLYVVAAVVAFVPGRALRRRALSASAPR
jgi:hypothetical protein